MSRLSRNIAYNLGGQFILLLLSFVAARYVARGLGRDVLGLIYFSLMLNAIVVAVLEMGVCATTVKEIAANETKDRDYVIRLVQSGALLYWVAYLCVGALALLLTPAFVEHWITLESIAPDSAIYLLRVLIVSAMLALPRTFYASVFRGMQRMGTPNAIDVVTTAIQHVGSVVIIGLLADPRLVAQWMAAIYVVRILVYLAFVSRHLGVRAIVPRLHLRVLRRNRDFAGKMMAISILAMIQTQTDKLVIATLLPVAQVGVYGLLYGAIARGGLLTSAVAQAAFPALSELLDAGREQEALAHYRKLQNLLCFALAPIFALLAFFSLPLFTVVLDADSGRQAVLPAVLLAVAFYLNGTLNIPYYYSVAANKPEIATRLNLYALVLILPLTILLTWMYGLVGSAAAWVCYQLFSISYAIPRICRECLKRPVAEWYLHLLGVLAVITFSYGVVGLLLAFAVEPSLYSLIVGYGLASILYLPAAWFMLDDESRHAAVGLIRSLWISRREG